jgi:hypothetical protein
VTRSARLSPTIGTALLCPQARIARVPLGRWAAGLRQGLHRSLSRERTAAGLGERVGGVANNAAFIAAQRGERDIAWGLCERHLWWQHRLCRRAHDPILATRCLAPWVNLARLEALAGECEGALARLRPLGAGRAGRPLALQPARGDGVGCQSIAHTDAAWRDLVENAYVIESLKALLLGRRWEGVRAFAAGMRDEGRTRLAHWADEAEVVAACRMGDFEGGARTARTALDRPGTAGWYRATFVLRLAEVHACAGEMDRARAALARLADAAARLSDAARSKLQPLYVLVRVSAACVEAGMDTEAAAVARAVLAGARAADDEVMQVEVLRILSEVAPAEERAQWVQEREALEAATEYRRYRRPDAPSTNAAEFASLYREITDVFAA